MNQPEPGDLKKSQLLVSGVEGPEPVFFSRAVAHHSLEQAAKARELDG
jgi:hypothetical protein